jgi:uncharacterized protein
MIELYNATFKPEYLKHAVAIQQDFYREFFDDEFGGYFFTANDAEELLGRQKEIYDGALPSSNSVAAHNGIRLSKLTADPACEQKAESVFKAFSEQITDTPAGYTKAVYAYDLYQTETAEVVITAQTQTSEVKRAIALCRKHLPQGSTILLKTAEWNEKLNKVSPFVRHYPVHDRFSVYVCRNFECKAPVYSVEELKMLISH